MILRYLRQRRERKQQLEFWSRLIAEAGHDRLQATLLFDPAAEAKARKRQRLARIRYERELASS